MASRYTPHMCKAALLTALLLITPTAHAQWQLQDTHITADLRGIDSLGNGVAWASGSNGTVLRTEDAGFVWQLCATPPGAETLDFRGIQAFDNNTAIVMSSGKGNLSRLYKTTDGCQTWKLLFTNPDKDGFWDALRMYDEANGLILGDPVDGRFVIAHTWDGGHTFPDLTAASRQVETNTSVPRETSPQGAFAASNSALLTSRPDPGDKPEFGNPCEYPVAWFGTSGPGEADVLRLYELLPQCSDYGMMHWERVKTPLAGGDATSGVFSIAAASHKSLVAVGGDYTKPATVAGTAAFSQNSGKTWRAAITPPHGYRSAVAYDPKVNTWITVGPNGTDISTDDGRNWRALKPNLAVGEPPDADRHWNALSLPFVVGPHGRIGTLRPEALPSAVSPGR